MELEIFENEEDQCGIWVLKVYIFRAILELKNEII